MTSVINFKVAFIGRFGRKHDEHVIRWIEIEETDSLHNLHEAIIFQAFGWKESHLYSFFMDNKPPFSRDRDKSMEYTPEDPDSPVNLDINGPKSSYTKLKELNLVRGQKFLFLFDYGDDNLFEIQVDGVSEAKPDIEYPIMFYEVGEAPEQYEEVG